MRRLIILLLVLAAFLVFNSCTQNDSKIIGMKIYEYHGDYNSLTSQWVRMGINTSFISESLAANDTFRQALKRNKISTFIIFPVFQNPDALKQDSGLYGITNKGTKTKDDWVEFVCPSRITYRNAKVVELADQIKKFNPDGISIDFIREFVFWEMIYPDRSPGSIYMACFCDSCLKGFSQRQHITIPDTCFTTPQKANWVMRKYPEAWDAYRCDLIAIMIKDLSEKARQIKPGLTINIHVVPWREEDFGGAAIRVASQDLKKISKFANFISPMCYSQMLKRNAVWIADVVADMNKRSPGMILPSIQVYPYYIDRQFTAADFKQCVKEALKPPSRGVVFFSWPLFEKDSSRMKVVKEVITQNS
jgi:hypothetical protein